MIVSGLIGLGAGIVVGGSLTFLITEKIRQYKVRQLSASLEKEKAQFEATLKSILDQITTTQQNTVDARLQKAIEISAQQSKIDPRASQDQLLQYNNLELEKLVLLQTILKEGHDPVLTVSIDNQVKQIKLSNYIASIQKNLH